MSGYDKVVRELVRFVREQRAINKELKGMAKSQAILLRDHDKWMKDHEVSLRLHYRLIAALGEKLH